MIRSVPFAQNDGGAVTTARGSRVEEVATSGPAIVVGLLGYFSWRRPTPGAPKHGRSGRGPQAPNRLIFCYLGLKKASAQLAGQPDALEVPEDTWCISVRSTKEEVSTTAARTPQGCY